MAETETEPGPDEGGLLGNKTAVGVSAVCGLMALLMVGLLFVQLNALNADPNLVTTRVCEDLLRAPATEGTPPASSALPVPCLDTAALQALFLGGGMTAQEASLILLEFEAQSLRTKRAQSLVGARIFIQAMAILAGLTQLILGSAIVFARVRSNSRDGLTLWRGAPPPAPGDPAAQGTAQTAPAPQSLGQGIGASLITTFPGVLIAAFGLILVMWSVWASMRTNFVTQDLPVYVEWSDGLTAHMTRKEVQAVFSEICDDSGTDCALPGELTQAIARAVGGTSPRPTPEPREFEGTIEAPPAVPQISETPDG